jgi:hypothetical protein
VTRLTIEVNVISDSISSESRAPLRRPQVHQHTKRTDDSFFYAAMNESGLVAIVKVGNVGYFTSCIPSSARLSTEETLIKTSEAQAGHRFAELPMELQSWQRYALVRGKC